MGWVKGIVALALLVLVAGLGELWAERRDAVRFPPPGRLIALGDHRLHLWCAGAGSPTVLLISGDDTPAVTLYPAQRRIMRTTRVCSYDRAGLGWSDPPARPMGLADQVDDLVRLLRRAGERAPLLLVPESGGNLIALALFDRSPGEIAGMVMVDGSEPELWFRGSPDAFPLMRATDPVWQAGWRLGIVRLALPLAVPDWVEALPSGARGQFEAVWSRPMPSYGRDTIDRWERTPAATRPRVVAGALGQRPLYVIRHGVAGGMGLPAAYERAWPAAQARLATLSRDSRIIVARRNHHPIAEENPDLVAAWVADMIHRLRARRPGAITPDAAGAG
jgi:pimeloyl-ACP methyl ester carboxylesterase